MKFKSATGIKLKIMGGFAIVFIIFVSVIIFNLINVAKLQKNLHLTLKHPFPIMNAIGEIKVLVATMHRTMKDIVLSSDPDERKSYQEIVENKEKEALDQFEIIFKLMLTSEGQILTDSVKSYFSGWRPIRANVLLFMDANKTKEAEQITKNQGAAYVNNIMLELDKLGKYSSTRASLVNKNSEKLANQTFIITLIALNIFGISSFTIAVITSSSIINRLAIIKNAATKIAQGDLQQKIIVENNDEISQLAELFNQMSDNLRNLYNSLEKKIEVRTRELVEKNKELTKLKNSLEIKVIERTHELAEHIQKLEENKKDILFMVENLNQTTNQLQTEQEKLILANKELESFAYSVSHDLRSPLRAIIGFTSILMQEYVNYLDDEGKRLGNVIQQNAQKMGQLIDDLLAFSRMGRTEMHFTDIDMNTMVNTVYFDLTSPNDRERVNFTVSVLPQVKGDTSMMRQVWTNLLSNALKFSATKNKPEIFVTFSESADYITFVVKDNGAGFNNKYKDKLFGVFQRLHSEKEFKGTGVGLAIVDRIIKRHGGLVCGDGKIDEGAVFYFSLPR